MTGHLLAHESLEFGVWGGFSSWQRGPGTGDAGGWVGVTVKVRGSGQPLPPSSEEATSHLVWAHLRTVDFSDSPSPTTSRKAKP